MDNNSDFFISSLNESQLLTCEETQEVPFDSNKESTSGHQQAENKWKKASKTCKISLMKQISNFNKSFPQIQSLKCQHSNKMMMTATSGPFSNLLLLWKKIPFPSLFPSFLRKMNSLQMIGKTIVIPLLISR